MYNRHIIYAILTFNLSFCPDFQSFFLLKLRIKISVCFVRREGRSVMEQSEGPMNTVATI